MTGDKVETWAYVDPVRWGGEFWVWERPLWGGNRGEFVGSASTLKGARKIAAAWNARKREG